MTRTLIATVLWLLSIGSTLAGSAQTVPDYPDVPETAVARHKLCYYEVNGFTYHYVIPAGLSWKCAETIETPFAPIPTWWAVLIKEELEMHPHPNKLCYYGISGGRLLVKTEPNRNECPWAVDGRGYDNAGPGLAALVHNDILPSSNTRMCFYRVRRSGRPTHYLLVSKHRGCRTEIHVK